MTMTNTYHAVTDLTGQRFGRLTVVKFAGRRQTGKRTRPTWECRCECGAIRIVFGQHLRNGNTLSCGCYARDNARRLRVTHGESKTERTAEYRAYHSAKERCCVPTSKDWKNYGGRGIEFRFHSYVEFLAELGRKPSPKHSLDRIDVEGHYEPGNVRWATSKEQVVNRRAHMHRYLTAFGTTQRLYEWAEQCDLPRTLIMSRINKTKWCVECAVTVRPNGGTCSHKS